MDIGDKDIVAGIGKPEEVLGVAKVTNRPGQKELEPTF